MMNERNFLFAVIIALIVPIAFDIAYFIRQDMNKENSNYVYKRKEGRELLLLGSDRLDNTNSNHTLDFEVYYVSGDKKYETYKIFLDDIEILSNDKDTQIRWILSMYDVVSKEYFDFATGLIGDEDIEKLVISPGISIAKDEMQLFRLYYYIVESQFLNNVVGISANINLELE